MLYVCMFVRDSVVAPVVPTFYNCLLYLLDFDLLSGRSPRGFMHMKIVSCDDGGSCGGGHFILGQFSQPFDSIPQMIHHYTINKLPIKGAEHMSLLHPVNNELL